MRPRRTRQWSSLGRTPRTSFSTKACRRLSTRRTRQPRSGDTGLCGTRGPRRTRRSPAPSRRVGRDFAVEGDHHLVDVAPAPALRLVIGFHDRVPGGVEMLGPMAADRLVAAADVAAHAADAQVHPILAELEALLAAIARGLHLGEHPQMLAAHAPISFRRWFPLLRACPPDSHGSAPPRPRLRPPPPPPAWSSRSARRRWRTRRRGWSSGAWGCPRADARPCR